MTARLHTTTPRVDPRFPHMAPMLGAVSIPYVAGGEISAEPEGPAMSPEQETAGREPLPEVLLGVATAGASGALTGGLAAGSWEGAAIGTGVSWAAWATFTLLNTWRTTGRSSRIVLGVTGVLGAGMATAFILMRRRRS